MDQIVTQGALPPSKVVSGYPPELEAIVMTLLERDPNARYATGEELLYDLDAFIAKHGLWLSPRALGKYMRTVFAEQIKAWEEAEQEGESFATHVAKTHVRRSHTASDEMVALQVGQRVSASQLAMEPLCEVKPLPLAEVTPLPEARLIALPDAGAEPVHARASKRIALACASALVVGAGALSGFFALTGLERLDVVPPQIEVETLEEPRAVEASAPMSYAEATTPSNKVDDKRTKHRMRKRGAKQVIVKQGEREPAPTRWDPNSPFLLPR
jgi:hypothetical protein